MKHGGLKTACLALLSCLAVAAAQADENTVNLESKILESFDGDSGYVWKATASKFTTVTDKETFPKISTVPVWPVGVFGSKPQQDTPLNSLGVWGRFDRKGYNWIDVYPTAKDDDSGTPAEIPVPGRAKMIDLWVWGSNFNYYLEVYLRDYKGVVHLINMGDLTFQGWQNMQISLPSTIPQSRRTLPRRQGITFVKFRIWTRPSERVDDFQIYFDQLKVLTDMFESRFDGDTLADPEQVQELWSSGTAKN